MTRTYRSLCIAGPLSLLLVAGCASEPPKPAKPEGTIENLKVAHAIAFRRAVYYADAARSAQRERLGNLALMFRAIARSETIHAEGHEALLTSLGASTDTTKSPALPVGTIRQILKMSLSLESTETQGVYPVLAQSSNIEKVPEATSQATTFRQADEGHTELLREAQDRRGVLPIRSYAVCQQCGTIVVDGASAACSTCGADSWEKVS